MKEKKYYIGLAGRYFDADTTLSEEQELRRFLAGTTDPDFDEVKAVMGFMLVTAGAYGRKKISHAGRRAVMTAAVAASVATLLVLVPFIGRGNEDCIMISAGHTTTNHEQVIDEMDRQMAMMINSVDENSMENDMAIILN